MDNRKVMPGFIMLLGLLMLIDPILALLKVEGTFGRFGWLRLAVGILFIAVGLYHFIRVK